METATVAPDTLGAFELAVITVVPFFAPVLVTGTLIVVAVGCSVTDAGTVARV